MKEIDKIKLLFRDIFNVRSGDNRGTLHSPFRLLPHPLLR